jgi:hypothetical protein
VTCCGLVLSYGFSELAPGVAGLERARTKLNCSAAQSKRQWFPEERARLSFQKLSRETGKRITPGQVLSEMPGGRQLSVKMALVLFASGGHLLSGEGHREPALKVV